VLLQFKFGVDMLICFLNLEIYAFRSLTDLVLEPVLPNIKTNE